MNNFVISCNTWDLKISMESLLWEVFEYIKIRNESWMKTAIICSSVQIWFSKFFYLIQFTEPRCLQSFGIFLAWKEPRPKSTGFFCGIPEKSVYDSKPRSLQQLKKIVELCARNVSRETLIKAWWKTSEKEPPYAWRMRGATSNTFSNNRLISFVNKTSHNI